MLHIHTGQDTNMIFTLSERVDTQVADYAYRLVAVSRATGDKVAIEIDPATDLSEAPGRYNSFDLEAERLYGLTPGQWSYEVHQVRPGKDLSLALLETGLLDIHAATGIMDEHTQTQPDQQLLVINFALAQQPTYQEKRGAAGGYMEYGADNLYPEYLLRLFDNSPKHNAIIRGKATYITGNGFVIRDAKQSRKAADFIAHANRNESLAEILTKVVFDLEIFGGAYLQIVWSAYGKGIAEIYHTDFSKVRTNRDNTQFWYKDDWSETRGRRITLPAFNPAVPGGSQMLMLKEYRPGAKAYGLPGYLGALNHIEADIEVGRHVNNNAQSGFTGSKHITLFEGPVSTTDEKKKTIERKLRDKFTGGAGQKIIVGFAASKEMKPEIEDLGSSDLTKEDFTAVDELIQANIYAGHQVTTPAIFGVATPGKLGATSEMRDGYEIFKATYVNAKQIFLEGIFNKLAKLKGVEAPLQIAPVDPLNILDAQAIAAVMTDDEKREKAGLKPLLSGKKG